MQTKKYIYKDDIKRKNILNKSHTHITCKRCGVVCGSLILQSTPKRKKRYTDRAFASKKKKKGASEEEHAAIGLYMRFYQSLSSLNFFLSLFLKTEFLFGKTNWVKFHEKFLTPYMKLEVLQIKQTNKVFDFTTLNQIYGILDSTIIWSPWL